MLFRRLYSSKASWDETLVSDAAKQTVRKVRGQPELAVLLMFSAHLHSDGWFLLRCYHLDGLQQMKPHSVAFLKGPAPAEGTTVYGDGDYTCTWQP